MYNATLWKTHSEYVSSSFHLDFSPSPPPPPPPPPFLLFLLFGSTCLLFPSPSSVQYEHTLIPSCRHAVSFLAPPPPPPSSSPPPPLSRESCLATLPVRAPCRGDTKVEAREEAFRVAYLYGMSWRRVCQKEMETLH